MLAFLSEHRLARVDHLHSFIRAPSDAVAAQLDALAARGLVRIRAPYEGASPAVQISRRGLTAIESSLPVPSFDHRGYAHDVGLASVWLAARAGAFGPLREIIAERPMRSRDRAGRRADPPLAVRLGGVGPRGVERLHYPDLLLVTREGRRIAVELELTTKSRTRRETILAGFGAEPHIDGVLYLVTRRSVGAAIAASAARLGISDRVMVQRATSSEPAVPPDIDHLAERTRGVTPIGSRGVAR